MLRPGHHLCTLWNYSYEPLSLGRPPHPSKKPFKSIISAVRGTAKLPFVHAATATRDGQQSGSKRRASGSAKKNKPAKAPKQDRTDSKRVYTPPPGLSKDELTVWSMRHSWDKFSTSYLLAWEWDWVCWPSTRKRNWQEEAEELLGMGSGPMVREHVIKQLCLNDRERPADVTGQFQQAWRDFRKAQGDPVGKNEVLPKLAYDKNDD